MGAREQALRRIRAVTIGLAALAAVGSAALAAVAHADTTAASNTGGTSTQTTNPNNGGVGTGGSGFDGGPRVGPGTGGGHATSGGT